MNIGFYYKDTHNTNDGYRFPEQGNPGIGGTQYMFLMLMRYLSKMYKDINIFCYHTNRHVFPDRVFSIELSDEDALFAEDLSQLDILIFRAGHDRIWYENLERKNVRSIAWLHNYCDVKQLELLYKCNSVKRVVCVGKQQYDSIRDHRLMRKATFIYNMFDSTRTEYTRVVNENIVTYVGSLIESKGFGVLAEQWRSIIRRVPDAQLYVIGSQETYHSADSKEAQKVLSFINNCRRLLSDKEGNLLPSVHFCGNLGTEKVRIYQRTKVGIANPTAKTETFCISAVEMGAFGIPVVSKAKGGLLDTVKNGKTGILFRKETQLADSVVKLLVNSELNFKLGGNAKSYVARFSPDVICPEWYKLFKDIVNGEKCKKIPVTDYYLKDYKWLKMINFTTISLLEVREMVRKAGCFIAHKNKQK